MATRERGAGGGAGVEEHGKAAEDAEEDAVAVAALESELTGIEERFKAGEMQAFGAHRKDVLGAYDAIRKSQLDIFSRHMHLEISFKAVEPDATVGYNSKQFCEHFPKAFEERASDVTAMTTMVNALASTTLSATERKL